MLYFNINGYEEFKGLFGKRVTNNGSVARSNKILLEFWKDQFRKGNYKEFGYNIKNIANLYSKVIEYLTVDGGTITLNMSESRTFHFDSPEYHTDEMCGRCKDYDERGVRYVRNDNGKAYKMKVSKMLRHIMDNNDTVKDICEQAKNQVIEKFNEEWIANAPQKPEEQYRLVVDDDFEQIYSSRYYKGNFGSCMAGECQYSFYDDAVKASAASLWDSEDNMVARCVIFNKVYEKGSDRVWRLAERQYSSGGDDVLKRKLVVALIKGGYIDGYKQVGVDCHNAKAYVDNAGNSLSDKTFYIDCDLDYGDTLSYQDSFKWYDMDRRVAYNDSSCSYDKELDTTDPYLEGEEYDDYHDRYCDSVTHAYHMNRYGNWTSCYVDSDIIDEDFEDIGGEYYLREDLNWSDYENAYLLPEESCYVDRYYDYISDDNLIHCEYTDEYVLYCDSKWSDLLGSYVHEDDIEDLEEEYKINNPELVEAE